MSQQAQRYDAPTNHHELIEKQKDRKKLKVQWEDDGKSDVAEWKCPLSEKLVPVESKYPLALKQRAYSL